MCGIIGYAGTREAGLLLLDGHQRVGITAGASTPDDAIDAVVARLHELAPE